MDATLIAAPKQCDYGDQETRIGPASCRTRSLQVFADGGLVDALRKALANRFLNAELDEHLADEAAAGKSNPRNGYSANTVISDTSRIELKVPRDREGTSAPKLNVQPAPISGF